MTESDRPQGALGLADFISDLRAELGEAYDRGKDQPLRLEIETLTMTLDVGVTLSKSGRGSTKVGAKFWVLASAEGALQGERSSQRMTTQNITLTLKPMISSLDEEGFPALKPAVLK